MTKSLPKQWEWATVDDVAELIRGVTFKKVDAQNEAEPGLVPIARAGNLEQGRTLFNDNLIYVSYHLVTGEQYLRAGDVLVAMSSGSLSVVGKSAIVAEDWVGGHGAFMAVIRALAGMNPTYLGYFLQSHVVRTRWRELAAGTNINNLKKGDLLSTAVPIAPADEQVRIAQHVREACSRLDAVESRLRSLLDKLKLLQSAILADAFHANRNLPPHWMFTTVGRVAEVNLGRQRSPQHHTGKQMRPYVRAANVTWNGISLDDVKEMNFNDQEFERYRLESGDLLLNEASGTPSEVGKPAIWDGQIEDCCFQNTLLRLRPRGLDLGYLYWYCYFSALTGRFGEAGRGVNIRHLGKRGLSRFPIPVAPRREQSRIADDVSEQFDQMESLQQSIEDARSRVAMLRRSVLAEAFAGRLVPQDPDDEPASVMLQRIAASRPTKPKRRRRARA